MDKWHSPRRIDVIVTMLTSFGRGVFEGVREFAEENGRIPVYFWNDPAEFKAQTADYSARSLGVIGGLASEADAALMKKFELPAVNISGIIDPPILPTVRNDDKLIGAMAARYFIDLGFTNFAFLGIDTHAYSEARKQGFIKTLEAESFKPIICEAKQIKNSAINDLKIRLDFLRKLPPQTALFCCNDVRARHAAIDCHKLDIAIPGNVAILGVDDDPVQCALASIQLSSIKLPAERIGFLAAKTLMDLNSNRPIENHIVELPPLRVVERESTDIFAVDDQVAIQARRFIEMNAFKEITVDDIVHHVAISRRMLERRFTKAFGKTMQRHIRDLRVKRAKELLANTETPINWIAEQAGFGEAFYLSRVFKKETGISPRQFRLSNRQQRH